MVLDIPSYNRQYIYNQYIKKIEAIKFTTREIDVMSCIVHNRTEKKIGNILSISYRTVGVHVRNIMNKLDLHTKDSLIDYIEKTGKLGFFRKYYFYLVSDLIFYKFLFKLPYINKNRGNITKCHFDFNYLTEKELLLIGDIINYLKHAKIEVLTNLKDKKENAVNFSIIGKNSQLNIDKISENSLFISLMANKDNNFYGYAKTIYVDLGQNYYASIIKIIRKIIKNDNLEPLISEFTVEYQSTLQSYGKHNFLVKNRDNTIIKYTKKNFAILILVLSLLIGFYHLNAEQSDKEALQIEDIELINHQFQQYISTFSADNAAQKPFVKNQDLISTVENIINTHTVDKLNEYFSDSRTPSQYLSNYIYHLQALASYYMYNNHDGKKANQILFMAKNLMESCVNSKSNVHIDFDATTPEEIFAELKIIKYFPELYTRVIYSLARTFIYLGDGESGRKYFTISKSIGTKLNLFEGYLSDSSGLLFLDILKSEDYIANGEIHSAIDLLKDIISRYEQLNLSSKKYIKDFRPGIETQEIVDLSNHIYSIFDHYQRIISCYGKLLKIAQNSDEKLCYIKSLALTLEQFFNRIDFVESAEVISSRKIATIYNSLANIYLELYYSDLYSRNLNEALSKYTTVNLGSNLDIAENLFTASKNISRNTDFTKADAYDGLVRVYEEKLKAVNNSSRLHKENDTRQMEKLIRDCQKKRDNINTSLKRG